MSPPKFFQPIVNPKAILTPSGLNLTNNPAHSLVSLTHASVSGSLKLSDGSNHKKLPGKNNLMNRTQEILTLRWNFPLLIIPFQNE